MASQCGHEICPSTNCGLKYALNGGRKARCRRIQSCFPRCSSLQAKGEQGFTLYNACLGHCHLIETDPRYPMRYETDEQYLCDNFDPNELVLYFGVNPCQVDLKTLPEYQQKLEKDQATSQQRKWIYFAFLVVAGLVGYLLISKK